MTLRDWLNAKPFTLAMSSGFFGFYAHAGVLKALEQEGIRPARVRGSSAGALITGLWASGLSASDIAAELLAVKREDFWDPRPGLGLLRGTLFQARLERMMPVASMDRCRVPVSISVFDGIAARTRVLTDGHLPTIIRASCALPFFFQPVWIENRPFLDGGIADRSSLKFAPRHERTLYHHLAPNSFWRRKNGRSVQIPVAKELCTLVVPGLPRVTPFKLSLGQLAFERALEETKARLAAPV